VFEPQSVYGNYFVGIDGEGLCFTCQGVCTCGASSVYGLLDSSMSDYERLYTGGKLTTLQCLDWVWSLGEHAGYATFVLFGASYDFNNWMHDIPFEDVKRLHKSEMVRIGDYLVIWQPHFRFEIRKILDEDTTAAEYSDRRYRYRRVQTLGPQGRSDFTGLQLWDVAPWWQTSFIKALDLTLKDSAIERELIEVGKDARGSFTADRLEWVSRYNRSECRNLAYMMVELDRWLEQAGIRPKHYNGPGSAAKALLTRYAPYLHAGRRIDRRASRGWTQQIREYHFPGADNPRMMMYRAMSAYAGGLNRQLKIGYHAGTAWQADRISAYPHAMRNLPCLTHGEWIRTRKFDSEAFGLWKVRYHATRRMPCYPFFWRSPEGNIEYPHGFAERWAHTPEVAAALAVDAHGVDILDGWMWQPHSCDDDYPFWWVTGIFKQRQQYKKDGNEGGAHGLKYPLNALFGSLCQARGGTPTAPPWSQQVLWAGLLTAYTRASLFLAHSIKPNATIHMATDGIISTERLPLDYGKELGQWELTQLHGLSVVQYGVYAAESCDCGKHPQTPWHHRERGFVLKDEQVPEFVKRVHEMWATGHWRSLDLPQQIFVTAGLVAQSEKRYDEWCEWQSTTRTIELDAASIYQLGHVNGMPGLWDIEDVSHKLKDLPTSMPYQPRWGKGENFPREWIKQESYDDALLVAAEA